MGIPCVNSLQNMEYMLYGGTSGLNANCPSYTNGYQASNSIFNNYGNYGMYGNYINPNFNGYYNQTGFGQNIPTNYSYQTNNLEPQIQTPSFQKGLTQEDMDKLADYYAKNNALEEGFIGAATGGLSWMAFEHLQSIFHPKNAWKGIKKVREVFKDIPEEFAKKNAALVQDAKVAVQQTFRDTGKKGWWSGWLRKSLNDPKNPENIRKINELLDKMKTAAGRGDADAMAKLTQELQATRGMDGKIVGALTGRRTVAERLAEATKNGNNGALSKVEKSTQDLIKMNEAVITNNFGSLIKSAFKKDFIGFMAFETIFNAGKIMTAFKEDTTTGLKQTCQSLGKSTLGVSGWCVGRAAGTWAGAKIGATIGSGGGPLGTIVGGLIGFTVGSIGMWAGHKLGNLIFGTDVSDKLEAKQMAKNQEGQAQLLQFAAQKAQEGKTDAKTNQIIYKAINTYA